MSPPIQITKRITKRLVRKGWLNKAKGLKQVLWERGWIDESNLSNYSKIKHDENGDEIEELSLLWLMQSCLDYANEDTELQVQAKKFGATVLCTTKYHAKIAGEGIEFSWGVSKSVYRAKKYQRA